MKIISGIVIGVLLAFGGMWAYHNHDNSSLKTENIPAKTADIPTLVKIGEPTLSFKLTNQAGQEVVLSDYIGEGPIVLEWFNKDCPYVRKFYDAGEMQRLQKRYTDKGVTWLRIVSSAPGKQGHLSQKVVKSVHNKSNATHTLLDPSGKVGRFYGAKTTPHMFVVNKRGTLVYGGAIDSIQSTDSDDIPQAENYVASALDALAKGEDVKQSSTEPYGCSVKY